MQAICLRLHEPFKPFCMRVFAISDIHGCNRTFRHLLFNVLQLGPSDCFFLVGDYVNRGPDSLGVIDTVLALLAAGYQLTALRGNHEDRLIYTQEAGIINLDEKYIRFVQSLANYTTWEQYILVHAGLNFDLADPFTDDYAMRWIRGWEDQVNEHWLSGRQLIFGHIRRARQSIEQAVAEQRSAICIDNGCFDVANPEQGHLCAYELNTHELIFQPNLDMDSPEVTYLSVDVIGS